MRKFLPKISLLLIFFGIILFVVPKFSSVFASSLILNPPFGNVAEGKDLTVDVVVKGEGETVDEVDAALSYDVNLLRVKDIKNGPFFGTYPIKKSGDGKIRITALAPKDGVKIFGDIVVATINFEVLDSGTTKITLDFTAGATNESNAAVHGTAVDSLKEVKSGEYNVIATPEKVTQAQIKKAKGVPSLIPFFLLLLILAGVGVWYYLKKRKPKEDVFIPEEFPLDRPPKLE